MPRSKHRTVALTDPQKREFLDRHLPNRVGLVKEALRRMPGSYYDLTVAAVHARALAQFLGLKISTTGQLMQDKVYFPHEGGNSYEVKIPDVSSLPLIDPASLSPADREALEIGFDSINREVAHLTFWDTAPRHHAADEVGKPYRANLEARIDRFCGVVLRETELFLRNT